MNTNNTHDLQALIELSAKATDGPWEMYGGTNHGRVQTADVIVCDGSAPHFMDPADAKFIAALVNWFRANHSTQTAPTLPGAGGGEWLPIESAPKDGTNVLLLIKWSEIPLIGHFSHNRWWGDTEHYETSCSSYCYGGSPSTATGTEPTHWQPLPAALPPQQGG